MSSLILGQYSIVVPVEGDGFKYPDIASLGYVQWIEKSIPGSPPVELKM